MATQEVTRTPALTGNIRLIGKVKKTSNPVMCCEVLPWSSSFAVGWSDGVIELCNSSDFYLLQSLPGPINVPVTCIRMDEKLPNKLLASYASGLTILWDLDTSERELTVEEQNQETLTNALNRMNGTQFAAGGSDAKIRIYDTRDGEVTQTLEGTLDPSEMDGHTDRVYAVLYHPSRENELISGGWDNTVQFWDLRNPYSQRKLQGPHICNNEGMTFLDANAFITAAWQKKTPLQIWNYADESAVEIVIPDEDTCMLYCVNYREENSMLLVGGSDENMLRVIDSMEKRTKSCIQNLDGAVYFAKRLPKMENSDLVHIVFGSGNTIYHAQITE